MKKIRTIAIYFVVSLVLFHIGCMSSDSLSNGGAAGYVVDSSGNPLSGVKVQTSDAFTHSDVSGKWALDSLPPQITDIAATRENYQSQSRRVEILSGQTLDGVNFVMAADTEIYDIRITPSGSTRANVVFHTINPSRSRVKYGKNNLLDQSTPENTEYKFSHSFELTGLTPASTYRIQCIAVDKIERKIESEIKLFNTDHSIRGEPPTGLSLAKVSESNVIELNWNADSGADFAGYKLYRATSSQGPFEQVGTGVIMRNNYLDMNVSPGVKYYYRVTRVSGTGDETPPSTVESFLMPGRMNENTVWTAQNSPYVLTSDLVIAPGVSLVIDKGVTVGVTRGDQGLASNKLVELRVQGTLMIQGTSDKPVSFVSASQSPQQGDWQGIVFDSSADLSTSTIKGLNLSFGVEGISGIAGIPEIRDSVIRSCRSAGVTSRDARRQISLTNLEIDSCASGVLLRDNNVEVRVRDSLFVRCIYSIVCRDNLSAEITGNRVAFAGVAGIDVGNMSTSSLVSKNIIGYGSSGSGIVGRGNDQIRRNTIQSNIGIELTQTAAVTVRSNLILADNSKNAVGVLYRGDMAYSTASNTFQSNLVWDIPNGVARRYMNSDSSFLPGISGDMRIDPTLMGGNPFAEFPNLNFNYTPTPGSQLKGAGYDGEDVGAADVSN